MKKKVIYVSWMGLTDKVAEDWHVDFLNKNFDLEYWDVVSLVREDFHDEGLLQREYLKKIRSYDQLEFEVRKSANFNPVFILMITPCFTSRKIYSIFAKNNCCMMYILWGSMPLSSRSESCFKSLKIFFSKPAQFIGKAFRKIGWYISIKTHKFSGFNVVFAAGSCSLESTIPAKRLVKINLCDYDKFLCQKAEPANLVNYKYAVFLDINLPFQPDVKFLGLPEIDADVYYNSMNSFFKAIEKRFHLKIIISAHPSMDINNNFYESRDIYRMKTPQLVKNAEFVISHHSTSISYAVLFEKPCLFVYTNEMKRLYSDTAVLAIQALSETLSSNCYNVDDLKSSEIMIKPVCRDRYSDYKYKYLTSFETEEKLSRNIIVDTIQAC